MRNNKKGDIVEKPESMLSFMIHFITAIIIALGSGLFGYIFG